VSILAVPVRLTDEGEKMGANGGTILGTAGLRSGRDVGHASRVVRKSFHVEADILMKASESFRHSVQSIFLMFGGAHLKL
jgi:hypothetical protein